MPNLLTGIVAVASSQAVAQSDAISTVITWPVAFTMVGSIATVVIGLFTYLISAKKIKQNNETESSTSKSSALEVLEEKIENLEQKINDHEKRDTKDFETVNKKIDKLLDILMKILSDDRL